MSVKRRRAGATCLSHHRELPAGATSTVMSIGAICDSARIRRCSVRSEKLSAQSSVLGAKIGGELHSD